MTPENLLEIRVWFYKYANFEQSDDRYKHWACLMGKKSLDDFLLLKAYLRLLEHYSQETVTFLSTGAARRQLWALRARMHLLPHEPTPYMLGRALYCAGACMHWISTPQLAPVWTACEHDARQKAIAIKRYTLANRRDLAIADYIHRLVPVGQSRALFEPRSGRMFCPLSKKAIAGAELAAADAAAPPNEGNDAAAADARMENELAARDEVARQEAAAAPTGNEAEEEEARNTIRQLMADAEESESDSDSSASDSDDEEEEGADGEHPPTEHTLLMDELMKETSAMLPQFPLVTELRLSDNDEKSRAKAERRHIRRRTTKALAMMQRPVDLLGKKTCRASPLIEADMIGVIHRQGREAMALCCHCGDLMLVTNDKWTNQGLSCMNHAHVDEFGIDHPQRQAFAHQTRLSIAVATGEFADHVAAAAGGGGGGSRRGLTAGDHDRRLENRHPHVLHAPLNCAACQSRPTRKIIYAYDRRLRWHEVPLCDQELHALRYALPPTVKLGHANALAIEVVPLDWLAKELSWSNTRRDHQRQQRQKRAAVLKKRAAEQEATAGRDGVPREGGEEVDDDDEEDLLAGLEEAPASAPQRPARLDMLEREFARIDASALRRLVERDRPDLRMHWQSIQGGAGASLVDDTARADILEVLLEALRTTGRR